MDIVRFLVFCSKIRYALADSWAHKSPTFWNANANNLANDISRYCIIAAQSTDDVRVKNYLRRFLWASLVARFPSPPLSSLSTLPDEEALKTLKEIAEPHREMVNNLWQIRNSLIFYLNQVQIRASQIRGLKYHDLVEQSLPMLCASLAFYRSSLELRYWETISWILYRLLSNSFPPPIVRIALLALFLGIENSIYSLPLFRGDNHFAADVSPFRRLGSQIPALFSNELTFIYGWPPIGDFNVPELESDNTNCWISLFDVILDLTGGLRTHFYPLVWDPSTRLTWVTFSSVFSPDSVLQGPPKLVQENYQAFVHVG